MKVRLALHNRGLQSKQTSLPFLGMARHIETTNACQGIKLFAERKSYQPYCKINKTSSSRERWRFHALICTSFSSFVRCIGVGFSARHYDSSGVLTMSLWKAIIRRFWRWHPIGNNVSREKPTQPQLQDRWRELSSENCRAPLHANCRNQSLNCRHNLVGLHAFKIIRGSGIICSLSYWENKQGLQNSNETREMHLLGHNTWKVAGKIPEDRETTHACLAWKKVQCKKHGSENWAENL